MNTNNAFASTRHHPATTPVPSLGHPGQTRIKQEGNQGRVIFNILVLLYSAVAQTWSRTQKWHLHRYPSKLCQSNLRTPPCSVPSIGLIPGWCIHRKRSGNVLKYIFQKDAGFPVILIKFICSHKLWSFARNTAVGNWQHSSKEVYYCAANFIH